MTIRDLTTKQMESIVLWNENGNDALGEYPYTRNDLESYVASVIDDGLTVEELATMAGIL